MLKILGESAQFDLEELAKAEYKTLKQKENLYAELTFVSEEEIKELNKKFRNVDAVTDVLSFPTLDGIREKVLNGKDYLLDAYEDGIFIGSIAICTKRAQEQAVEYGHSLKRELTYLTLHGLLHLFGYDHMIESDKTQMRTVEEEILKEVKVFR